MSAKLIEVDPRGDFTMISPSPNERVGVAQALRGHGRLESGQVDRADTDAGQHAADVLLVVRIQRPGARHGRQEQADEERDGEAHAARWAVRFRNGDPDGIGGCRGHGSDILAAGERGPVKEPGSMMTPR